MSETRPRYQASKHICVDCRHYQAQTDRAGWCRHEQEAVSGIEGCYGFARIEPEIEIDATGVQNRQVGGDHYVRYAIQPWDIWREYSLDPWEASALKYLLRRKGKRLEDLEKCRHYLDYLIERERATGASDGG